MILWFYDESIFYYLFFSSIRALTKVFQNWSIQIRIRKATTQFICSMPTRLWAGMTRSWRKRASLQNASCQEKNDRKTHNRSIFLNKYSEHSARTRITRSIQKSQNAALQMAPKLTILEKKGSNWVAKEFLNWAESRPFLGPARKTKNFLNKMYNQFVKNPFYCFWATFFGDK